MILILGGTTEARLLLDALIQGNEPVIISTAYAFSEQFIPEHPLVTHITGKLNAEDLISVIDSQKIQAVVDATHPFAVEISKNAVRACAEAGVGYIRFERDAAGEIGYEKAHFVSSYSEAAELACSLGSTIFLATGSKSARTFYAVANERGRTLYIRVLPDEASVARCMDAGFLRDSIITGIGPFSEDDNHKVWECLGIDVVVTKESGASGGFEEKLRAAERLGIDIVIVSRPADAGNALTTVEEVIGALRREGALNTPAIAREKP